MSTAALQQSSVGRLTAEADAVGRLAQDIGAFAAAFATFESDDPNAFRWVLQRLELLPQCELLCEWIRVKLCVLRCTEVCGPPDPKVEVPELPAFARAIISLASQKALLHRIVDAVSCGDADAYRAAIAEAKLEEFCHLICRYVCSAVYRRICEVVCNGVSATPADAALDIRADAEVLKKVIANRSLIGEISQAAATLDCLPLQSAIGAAGFVTNCEVICRLICVWRCVWTCSFLCGQPSPVLTGEIAVEEARAFALAARQLATQPRALADLVAAIVARDAGGYSEVVNRFGLSRYCWQLCSWVCAEVCTEFCICICPPQLLPYFTSIGGYDYQTQIDSVVPATGLTYGDTRAFFETLRLNGVLTQTLGGQPLEYRFEFQPLTVVATNLATAITPGQTSITVTSGAGFPATPFNAVLGGANGGYEIVTVTAGPPGITWTILRGQRGTTALAAAVGALVTTGGAASGPWQPVLPPMVNPVQIGKQEIFHITPPFVTVVDLVVPTTVAMDLVSGWIDVPQGSGIFLNGNMIGLNSAALPSFPAADETGVTAGNPANHPLPSDLRFGLRMRVRQKGLPLTEQDGGTCSVVAIDNTLYNNVNRHPEWDGGKVSNQFAVAMVDVKELQTAGCAGITNSLTVLFTASHPNLGAVSLSLIGPPDPPKFPTGVYPFTLGPAPIPETGDWYGVAVPNGWTLADLQPCAYIVQLSVDALLTDGDNAFGPPLTDQIAFCLT